MLLIQSLGQLRYAAALAMACVLLAAGDSYAVGWRDTAATAQLRSAFEELRRAQPTSANRGLARGRVPDAVPVLLVEFPDQSHSVLVPQDSVHASFFGAGGSVRSFYQESSYGRFQLEGTTTPWLRLPQTLDYYANGLGGVRDSYPRNAQRMVEDAVRAADSSIDFSLYDNDGPDGVPSSGDDDGYVDGIMVVHAGTGAEYGDADNILSHSFFTSQPIPTNDGPAVWLYATVAETSPLGTNAHEFGHILGLPDLYQLGGRQGSAGGLGDWSLMGSGSWRGDGLTPTDLDAPSKIELGFVEPIIPTTNSTNLRLRAGRDGVPPDIYQVWTHGKPQSEYFVIVNRRREGIDSALPAGGGMLVYHVDLLRAGNFDRDSLRVQLLQADGLRQLELFQNNGNEGDPFPGSAANIRLDANTTPNTLDRQGFDTQVTIQLTSSPSFEMRFDLQIENRAQLVLVDHEVQELSGNGDGIANAGERLALDVTVRNDGLASAGMSLQAGAIPAGDASWEISQVMLGPMAKDETLQARFILQASASLGDPAALNLELIATDIVPQTMQVLPLALALGNTEGFLACLEPPVSSLNGDCSDPEAPWETSILRGTTTWSNEVVAGELGTVYRSAASATYPYGADMVLVSPPFNLRENSTLQLLHEWDTEDLGAGWCHAGGIVEISVAGAEWSALEPQGGSPRRLFGDSVPYLAGVGAFGGNGSRRWDRFDLAGKQGTAQLRFRFVSRDSLRLDNASRWRGWSIFRVEVASATPETEQPTVLRIAMEPNPVRFPAEVRFSVETQRRLPAATTRLLIFDGRGRLVRTLPHTSVPAQTARFVWDGTDRAGRQVASGVYFAQLQWGSQRATSRITVLR